MILKSTLSQVIQSQKASLNSKNEGLRRESLSQLPKLSSHALIVSGIRRCGKSTLLYQLFKSKYKNALFLNFEDPRLFGFEMTDLRRLDEIISESKIKELFFDEIQVIDNWELYVRQKLDENYKVVVTGSNASLLSTELGTKLTGRHITRELFPFSFNEFISFKNLKNKTEAFFDYFETGGFPEYIKSKETDILHQLLNDILIRDIAVRYGVRDVKTLQQLALYLISNIGKLITANRLKSLFDIKATSTMMEYLSHLEQSYLVFFVPKFSHSIRKQLINPRKVYAIDIGLVNVNSISFSSDNGRKFENLIYIHLRRHSKEIYYHAEKGECDFIVCEGNVPVQAIQVCYELNPDNLTRELNGIVEALKVYNLKTGIIVTFNQNDKLEKDGKVIDVISGSEFLLSI